MRRLIFTAILAALLPLSASAQWYLFPGSGHRKDTTTISENPVPEAVDTTEQRALQVMLSLPVRSKATPSSNFLDFYGGVILAVKEAACGCPEGISLKVFDTTDPTLKAGFQDYTECDLAIGPVSLEDMTAAFGLCPEKTIISPLEPRGAMLASSFPVIQVPSSWEDQVKDAVQWLESELAPSDNVVLLQDYESEASEMTASAVGYLNESGIVYTIANDPDRLETLCTSGCTRFVLITDNSTYIGDCVRNIALLGVKGFNVALYGTSKVRTCGEAEKGSLCSANARLCTSYFVDQTRAEVKAFRDCYMKEYGAEPGEFAYQGYDIAKYFLTAAAKDRNGWIDSLPDTPYRGLQSNFKFQESGRGMVNTAVWRLRYCMDGLIRTNN